MYVKYRLAGVDDLVVTESFTHPSSPSFATVQAACLLFSFPHIFLLIRLHPPQTKAHPQRQTKSKVSA